MCGRHLHCGLVATDPEVRVRFPALPDFLGSSGSGTGSTLPREYNWPPLWSSGQSSCLQIHRSGFDSRRYQIFWEAVGLQRGPFSLVSTIEELLGRKSSFSGLEILEYDRRDPPRWPRGTLYSFKLALTSPTLGGKLRTAVGIRHDDHVAPFIRTSWH
jgi:hypothetical protein